MTTKTLYAMIPPGLSAEDFATMLSHRGFLWNSVEEGRAEVTAAGNDPDKGTVVRLTLETLDANGKEII